jgi:hypothetical protein
VNLDAPFLFIASMDVDPIKEELFNRVYDDEHVHNLAQVPGVISIARYERQELRMFLGGTIQRMKSTHPKYHAIYQLESPDVLTSEVWRDAVEKGRWPQEIRPFTSNRQHLLARRLPSYSSG